MSSTGRFEFVHNAISEHARHRPTAIAVADDTSSLTCHELDRRANQLAQLLVERGVRPDGVVGLWLPRGPELVLAALAVLRAGGAYLPLDPDEPPGRVARILATAAAHLVLCQPERTGTLTGQVPVLGLTPDLAATHPDRAPEIDQHPDHLAYVIHTSGSTGTPKGVMVSHRSLTSMTAWHRAEYELTPADRTTMTVSPGFDASVCETWPALTAGATILVPDDTTRLAPQRLRDWLVAKRVTVSSLAVPLAELMLPLSWPPDCSLRVLLTGGDRLHLRPRPGLGFRLVNNYGPAENTVVATAGPVAPATEPAGTTPPLPDIGRPARGTSVYLLDADLREVEDGAVGELYLGGVRVARGYLGQPRLTADRFVPDPRPDAAGARLYRTGDLGRRRPDGVIEFCGRDDDQVKIRGHRIELAEVNAELLTLPSVAATHTAVRQGADGQPVLVSYLAPRGMHRLPDLPAIRQHLAERLPPHLHPAEFVLVDRLPLNQNGKVDRRALPEPRGGQATATYVAPRDDREQALAAIWREVFGQDRVGVHDSFFDLGGHSLSAARLVARIRDQLNADLPTATIFARPTIAELAKEIGAAGTGEVALPALRRVPRRPRMPLSVTQEQIWFLTRLYPETVDYNFVGTIRVSGRFEVSLLERALTEVARRHEILHTVYEEVDGRPWQVVRDPVPIPVEVLDLRDLTESEQENRLAEIRDTRIRVPFDLSRLPLVRWSAIQLGEREWELLMIEHHMVHDGWSLSRLMDELTTLYRAFAAGEPSPLPELTVHYPDFAHWQREALDSPAMRAKVEFWRERLADPAPPLSLTKAARPETLGTRGERIWADLPPALPDPIREFCRREGVSLFTTLLAGYTVVLNQLSGATDLSVGSAVANRRFSELEPVLGVFVNSIVLRCDLAGDPTFRELVHRVQQVVLGATANQDVPFAHLVRQLRPPHRGHANPYFQVMFSFHDSQQPDLDFAGASATLTGRHNGAAKADLDVVVLPMAERQTGASQFRDSRISLAWEYSFDVFDRPAVERLIADYHQVLASAVAAPDTPIGQLR